MKVISSYPATQQHQFSPNSPSSFPHKKIQQDTFQRAVNSKPKFSGRLENFFYNIGLISRSDLAYTAIIENDIPALEEQLRLGANPNCHKSQLGEHACSATPLYCAVVKDNLQATKLLLDYGADPEDYCALALHNAIEDGQVEHVQAMLNKKKMDMTIYLDDSALENPNYRMTQLLLEYVEDPRNNEKIKAVLEAAEDPKRREAILKKYSPEIISLLENHKPKILVSLINLTDKLHPNNSFFKQGNIGDCYLLAAVDSIIHSADREFFLKQFRVCKTKSGSDKTYAIQFPNPKIVGENHAFSRNKIGASQQGLQPVQGNKYIQLLELAYSKCIQHVRLAENPKKWSAKLSKPADLDKHSLQMAENGYFMNVAHDIFGGEMFEILSRKPQTFLTFLESLSSKPNTRYLLGASSLSETATNKEPIILHSGGREIQIPRNHAFSIRKFDLKKSTITVADPHDTQNKVYTLPMKTFCKAFYRIDGIQMVKDPSLESKSLNEFIIDMVNEMSSMLRPNQPPLVDRYSDLNT